METTFKTDPTLAPTIHKTRMVLIDVTIVVISTYIKYGIISPSGWGGGGGGGLGGKGGGVLEMLFFPPTSISPVAQRDFCVNR